MITILISDQEKRPWSFSDAVQTQRVYLKTGDYQISGLEKHLCIERKSEVDLLGTITEERDRFIKELERMASFRVSYLIIETDWHAIETGAWASRSQVHPNSVVGSILAFSLKYRVMPILAGTHDTAGRIAERIMLQYVALLERDFKLMQKIASHAGLSTHNA